MLISNAGALMICRYTFGGELAIQASIGLLIIASTTGISMAYYNIKRLQIDQHRAWMLRTFFYMGSIITIRLIMFIGAQIISGMGTYYQVWPCAKLDWLLGGRNKTLLHYPSCGPFYDGKHPNAAAAVLADFNNGGPEQIGAAFGTNFGMAMWLGLFVHAIGVEIYIHLTPGESARLRQISYERQLEAGFHHPGNAGLTVERLGDCDGTIRFAREKPQQVHEAAERSRETSMVAEP